MWQKIAPEMGVPWRSAVLTKRCCHGWTRGCVYFTLIPKLRVGKIRSTVYKTLNLYY
ncbi:hypothetical protein EJ05DRAFT_481078 [Pseudovirgaria hyperparasitica]|uniref:Uncharacterized protein n=1 Tax=Pseudovirgaria hyperparasitica TaxID=470096 RepID=A0A6A6VSF5_9PEZI|nr:uncharacterized protein EJ05DRAFT_481078 [Pseudovirgaria hyperparasitica]KAF2752716.1 hypothetical protein EJ05DRAFT_481078 [Pseudovirgaria hyperparasitica]